MELSKIFNESCRWNACDPGPGGVDGHMYVLATAHYRRTMNARYKRIFGSFSYINNAESGWGDVRD